MRRNRIVGFGSADGLFGMGDMNCPIGTVEKTDQGGNVYCVDETIADQIYHKVTTACPGVMVPFVDADGNEECVCPMGYQPSGGTCVVSTSGGASSSSGGGTAYPSSGGTSVSKAGLGSAGMIGAAVIIGIAALAAYSIFSE